MYPDEKAKAKTDHFCNYYAEGLVESAQFRKEYRENHKKVVKAHEMPMERSPDGLIKHIIHEKMKTTEMCIDVYMQFLDGGKSTGKTRHLTEEIAFIVEGKGYDLHWDVEFDCKDKFEWEWAATPKKFEWKAGDFLYIPPYVTHQRFNADPKNDARIVVINSRIVKKMGFDWFEQIENAEGF